ncbi:MAG: hypothetical protein JOZ68_04865 [Acidimicrobiia bacterium]|nr:hypothetical protein [Acidimicrobiia bacterium]
MPIPLVPTDDGWFEWCGAPEDAQVLVNVEPAEDGRYRVVGLQVTGNGVSAEHLRAIPVGRIEAAANAFHHTNAAPARKPKARVAEALRLGDGRGYPDEFYGAVAAIYHNLVGHSSRPIAELAEANEVPNTTAQRWVREARKRGKLPPGRPGKAG